MATGWEAIRLLMTRVELSRSELHSTASFERLKETMNSQSVDPAIFDFPPFMVIAPLRLRRRGPELVASWSRARPRGAESGPAALPVAIRGPRLVADYLDTEQDLCPTAVAVGKTTSIARCSPRGGATRRPLQSIGGEGDRVGAFQARRDQVRRQERELHRAGDVGDIRASVPTRNALSRSIQGPCLSVIQALELEVGDLCGRWEAGQRSQAGRFSRRFESG